MRVRGNDVLNALPDATGVSLCKNVTFGHWAICIFYFLRRITLFVFHFHQRTGQSLNNGFLCYFGETLTCMHLSNVLNGIEMLHYGCDELG